jgi:hypothetical protein
MTKIELLYGGTFEIDETDIKNIFLSEDFDGIVIETEKGLQLTIKNNKENKKYWLENFIKHD